MKRNWNTLPKRPLTTVRLRLTWKPVYTRIVRATVSLLLLLVLEFFLFKLIFAWY